MSPRPKSSNPHVPRSISLPTSLWLEIEEQVGKGSTSAWIARAAKEKLEGNTFTVAEATDIQLLGALLNRGVIYHELFYSLKYQVEDKLEKLKGKESN